MVEGGVVAALAQQIRNGPPVLAAWCGVAEPLLAEILVREGFDTAVLDMQHGAYDLATAMRGISGVALAGKPCIVRIPVGDFANVSRLLDSGAAAVIAPMINTVADARAFAAFSKFPPLADRSWGPHRAIALTGMDHPTYLAKANSIQLAIAMIETREALAALDDILAVPGIDGVFVGPSDLSIALSHGAAVNPDHPEVDKALTHVGGARQGAWQVCRAFHLCRRQGQGNVGARLCALLGGNRPADAARGCQGRTGRSQVGRPWPAQATFARPYRNGQSQNLTCRAGSCGAGALPQAWISSPAARGSGQSCRGGVPRRCKSQPFSSRWPNQPIKPSMWQAMAARPQDARWRGKY